MDKFSQLLKRKKGNITRALTDTSYKKIYQKENRTECKEKVNFELATYGDALLKMILCKILFEKGVDRISEEKKKYEKDEALVRKIAKHYDILSYMKLDREDENIPQDYNYKKTKSNKNPHKYIATAVEACLAAIYLDENNSIDVIEEIVKDWMRIIDRSEEIEISN